ncbi:MAG: hypothetical protein RH862_05005 [Leptospiraceae bacterium]
MTTSEEGKEFKNIFLVPWMLALLSPALVVFTIAFGGMIAAAINDAIENGFSQYTLIGLGMGGAGLYVHYEYLTWFWRLSNVVTIKGNTIWAKAPFSSAVELSLPEVSSLHRVRFTMGVILQVKSPGGSFQFALKMDRAGELVELILSKTPNLEVLDLGSYPEKKDLWKKEPDWALLNAAQKRAEENMRKRDQDQYEKE